MSHAKGIKKEENKDICVSVCMCIMQLFINNKKGEITHDNYSHICNCSHSHNWYL